MRSFGIIFLIIFNLQVFSQEKNGESYIIKNASSGIFFRADSKSKNARRLLQIAIHTQKQLNYIFGKLPINAPKAYISLSSVPYTTKIKTMQARFRTNEITRMEITEILHKLCEVYLKRRYKMANKKSREYNPPHWLVAAISYIAYERLDNPNAIRLRVPEQIRKNILNDKFPNIKKLTHFSVSEDEFWLYRYYSTHCHMLLKAIRRSGNSKTILSEILEKGINEKNSIEFIMTKVAKVKTERQLNAWYKKEFLEQCYNTGNPETFEMTVEKIEDITRISSIRPVNGKHKLSKIPLETIVDDPNYKINIQSLSAIQLEFFKALTKAPVYMRDSIKLFVESIEPLKKRKLSKFKREFKAARLNWQKTVAEMRALNNYMKTIEEKHEPVVKKYLHSFKILEVEEFKYRKLNPDLYKMIDTIEKITEEEKSKIELVPNRN